MNRENYDMLCKEYCSHTGKASNIARGIVIALFLTQMWYNLHISHGIVLFFILELCQYVFLGIRAELTLKEKISFKTSNRIGIVGTMLYYSKIVLALTLLINF